MANRLLIFFCLSFFSIELSAQLGFCQGNSGDPIFTEDFGAGLTQVPLPPGTTTYTYANGMDPDDGLYTVTSNTNYFDWFSVNDVTPGDTNGRMLVINSDETPGEFYRTTITGLCENTTYEFSSWLINLAPANGFCGAAAIPVNVRFEIWDSTDTNLLASGATGNIAGTFAPDWGQYALVFQTITGQTSVILKMINNSSGGCGNDLAIDDIVFKSCGDLIEVQDTSGDPTISVCESETPYSDVITALPNFAVFSSHFYQWQSSTDGVNWNDIPGETNATLTFTNITTTTFYRAKVAEFAANLSNLDCITFSDVYEITVNPNPSPPVSDGDVNFNCTTNQAILSVTAAAGTIINWYNTPTGGTVLQINSESYTVGASGTYYAEAVDPATGCVAPARVAVTAIASAVPDPPISNGDVDFNCTSNSALLSVSVPTNVTVNWYDSLTGGTILEADNPTFLATMDGVYYAEAVDVATGCVSAIRTEVTVTTVLPDSPVSDGDTSLDCITNESTISVTVPAGILVDWFDAPNGGTLLTSNSLNLVVNSAGTYYAEAFDTATGCRSVSRTTIEVSLEVSDDASFDISPTCEGAMVNVTGTTGGSFTFNPLPTDGAQIDANTGEVTNATPDTTYVIEYTTNGPCPTSNVQSFTVLPDVIIFDPTSLNVCDDAIADGITEIDLSLKINEITGNNPSYEVTYHLSLPDAETATNPLPTLYTNTTNGQIIFVRVVDPVTGCFATTDLELIVEQAPEAFTPQPLRYCDPDNDGLGSFTLTDADNLITGGVPGLTVSYHETEANANNNVDALNTAVTYNNITANQQTLYARVASNTITTGCASIVELELIVEPTPQLFQPSPLQVCDDTSANGFAVFDLTSIVDEVLNDQDPLQFNLSFFENETDAESDSDAILNPVTYTNTESFNQTIWIRVENTTTLANCYKLISLQLMVNPLPVLTTPPPLELCDVNGLDDGQELFELEDANTTILNGQTGISLSYYETQLDADNAANPIFTPYTNTSNPQTLFVRGENDMTGCYTTTTLTLRVNPLPSPEPNPEPIEVCDADNDGFAEFDLEQRTVQLANGEPNLVITYHDTQTDAEMGDNPIIGLYTNIVPNSQAIYVRSENTLTGCYRLTQNTLQLIVNPTPQLPPVIDPLIVCDSDQDGFEQFDLTTKVDEILNNQNPNLFDLTFYVSAVDAESGNNPIINEGSYTNISNPQSVFIRLYDPVTECYGLGEFELSVALPPIAIEPTQLNICDDVGEVPGDEIAVFDLTIKNAEITGGNAFWSVSYFETEADAQAQINEIPNPTQYTNTSIGGLGPNPQTVYAVVTDTNTGCSDLVALTIRVLPNPTPTPSALLPDLELCDDSSSDGFEVFNLQGLLGDNAQENLIVNGEPGLAVSYHESLAEANSGSNPILNPTQYTNIETPTQDIYVRVTNPLTGCFELVDFTLVVLPLPQMNAISDMINCELNTDGFSNFDLSSKTTEVLNGQDPTAFSVTYHDNLNDAELGINALVSPYVNVTNPQQIFVTITNNETGCSISTESFTIEVQEAAQANPDMVPIIYNQCDDTIETDANTTNDTTIFDLTTIDPEVLDGQDPASYDITYFETEEDADANSNPLPNSYENIVNPQTIYARVDNNTVDLSTGEDTSICYAITALSLQVNPLPKLTLAPDYVLCINTNGTEAFDALVIDTNLSDSNFSFVWSFNGTVITNETGASLAPSQGGNYSVEVTNLVTGCSSMADTNVIESEPPSLEVERLTQAFADAHVLQATATGIGIYEYSLDGGPWQNEGLFTNVSAGEHVITARDINGCGLDTATAFIVDYPLYFTPNGDGFNETWNISGIGEDARIFIFDRYGKLLKQISPDGSGWDGTYNGNPLPTSDYWFTVEYTEPETTNRKEFKAHFTLKR